MIAVKDTQKKGEGVFVHIGEVTEGTAKAGDVVELKVDSARRTRIRSNHSATHLLHEALRETLGTHVAQKGSLVAPDRLRFDFSHPKPISAEELEAVENLANEIILQNAPVTTRLMAVDDAIAEGAMALSVRNMVTKCVSFPWVRPSMDRKRARPIRWSFAAAPMCARPAISASSVLYRKAGLPQAYAVWKR